MDQNKDKAQPQQKEGAFLDINLDLTEGEWFAFFPSRVEISTGEVIYGEPVEGVQAKIRSTAPFLEERLKRQTRKHQNVLNPKTRSMERVPYFEEQPFEELQAETDDMYDYAIIDLEGFRDSKSKQMLKCTRDNKIALRRVELFRRYFERCQQVLHGNVEQEAKN